MKRRRFLIASGASLLGGTGLINQEPTVGVSFDIVGVDNADPRSVDSVLIDFENIEFRPKYISKKERADLIISVFMNGKEVGRSETKIPTDTKSITREDMGRAIPILCDEISSGNSIEGYVKIDFRHSEVNDTYRQDFTIDRATYSIPESILVADSSAESGVYELKPKSSVDSFKIYCNMDDFGGGWGLVGKSWGNGNEDNTLNLSQSEYLNRIMNVNGYNESELQTDREVSGADEGFAFLSKEKMNALFDAGARMFRVEFKGGKQFDDSSYSRQAFITPYNQPDFDAWHAIRDTKVFGQSGTCDSNFVGGLGTDYAAGTDAQYDSDKNEITESQTKNCGIGHWDDGYSYERSDGITYNVSRHGISGDIESGWEWLFVISPNDDRHPHGVRYDYARIWVR